MKALSIRQPWAWLICAGYKDIENRGWKNNFKGRIYIHAGKSDSEYCNPEVDEYLEKVMGKNLIKLEQAKHTKYMRGQTLVRYGLDFGAIIGEVDITACVTESESPWFVGKYGFVLANPKLYDKPIICRGQLGFFTPEFERVEVSR